MKKWLGRILAAVGVAAALCIVLTACISPDGSIETNQDPIANFAVQTGSKTLNVIFYGSSSFDPDGEVVLWNWNFGDGKDSSGETVAHTYINPGTYLVRLRVQDNDGAYGESTKTVVVIAPESVATDPVASFSRYRCGGQPQTGSTICFNGRSSYDPDGWITWGHWSFGDGSIISGPWTEWGMKNGILTEFSVKREVTHTYTEPGPYTVILTVVDDEGKPATAFGTVIVR